MIPAMLRRSLPLLLIAPLAGCVVGGNKYQRPRDLADSWLVDRSRLLAVRAEPPEIRPGESATFEALFPQPDQDEPWSRIWFACPVGEDGGGFGCSFDFGSTTGGTGAVPEGFIGIEPGLPPVFTAPTDILDDIDNARDLAEGVQILAQVAAMPPELLEDPSGDIDFNEVEVGYKRLVVSEASTPNRNPRIVEFVVDRLPIPADTVVHVTQGQQYELGVILEEDLIEEYEYLTRDGDIELRVEEPYATWYSTGGEIFEAITLYPYNESTWEAPEAGESGTWYIVVRDRRGGMTWHTQPWTSEKAPKR